MSSVGIIGGADSPTSVFVSHKFNLLPVIIVTFAVVAIVAIIIILAKKNKNNKNSEDK